MTNAHVVAGESGRRVVRPDGRRLRAQVRCFDPDRDLALLAVPGLGQAPLPLGQRPRSGTTAAVFGHPGRPGRAGGVAGGIRQQVNALGPDLYDLRRTRRGGVHPRRRPGPRRLGRRAGRPRGQVVGVAFAIAPDRAGTAYALRPRSCGRCWTPSARRRRRPAPVSTTRRRCRYAWSGMADVVKTDEEWREQLTP